MFLPKASPPPPQLRPKENPEGLVPKFTALISQFQNQTHRDSEKRRRGQTSWIFLSAREKRDFLLLTKGKAPLTFFFLCTVATARLGGARSAAFLLPLPATNEASQPRSGQTFSLSGSSPRGAGEWFPPRNAAPPGPGPGEAWVSAEDNFLVSALTSTHPAAGAQAGSGARRGRLRGRGQAGGGSSGAHFLRHISDI